MKAYKVIFLFPLVAAISSPVIAHYNDYGYSQFDQRIEQQKKRVKNGMRSGELTKDESRKLRKQHRYIKKLNRKFKKDGHLSRHERRILKRELKSASKRIYRLKHNDRYRERNAHLHRHGNQEYKGKMRSDSAYRLKHDRSAQLNHRD